MPSLSVIFTNREVRITWPTVTSATYALQWTSDFTHWHVLIDPPSPGTGAAMEYSHLLPEAAEGGGFYRLIVSTPH